MTQQDESGEFYDQEGAPAEGHAKLPRWLWITYAVVLAWGILWWILFWNGSSDTWFDRGAWTQLQRAAKTTYPIDQ